MPPEITLRELLYPLIVLGASITVALFFYWRIRRRLHRVAGKTKTVLDDLLVSSLQWPVFVAVVLGGAYFAARLLPLIESTDTWVVRLSKVAFVLVAGWAIASALDAIYRWYRLEVASKTRTPIDDWIVGLLRVLTPSVAVLLVSIGCLASFGVDTTSMTTWVLAHGSRIGLIALLAVAVIFAVGRGLPRAVKSLVVRKAPGQPEEEVRKRAETLGSFLVTVAEIFVMGIAVFMILSQLGIDIAPILTGVGVAGIAIGFGAQTLVKDYLAGLFVIMEDQYRVGDVVTVAGISGLVEQIDLRRTVLRDLDGIQHIVSNGEIRTASNFTKEVSRVNLNISVSYATDLDHAIEVTNRVCSELAVDPKWAPLITKTPEVLRVDKLGDSGIDLKILGETKPIRQWDVMGELRKRIKRAFDEERIEIPWPHTKVYFGNWPPLQPPDQGNGQN